MYLSDLVSSLLSIAAPSEPLAMSVSPPDDAELESSRVADDAARASIFTSEKFWPIFLNHLRPARTKNVMLHRASKKKALMGY